MEPDVLSPESTYPHPPREKQPHLGRGSRSFREGMGAPPVEAAGCATIRLGPMVSPTLQRPRAMETKSQLWLNRSPEAGLCLWLLLRACRGQDGGWVGACILSWALSSSLSLSPAGSGTPGCCPPRRPAGWPGQSPFLYAPFVFSRPDLTS